MDTILAPYSTSISELKRNPSQVIAEANGEAIAILNHNKPTAYLLPADVYESLLDQIEDLELSKIADARLSDLDKAVEISLDEL